jgi:hypothetical protein
MRAPIAHMPHPCDETDESGRCPFRVDAAPGEFTADRYELLADTAGLPGAEVPVGGPMFACHHTKAGAPVACAGWLAVCGDQHLGVRMAIAEGRLSVEALSQPGHDLFSSYDEMAREQADGVYDPSVAATSRRRAGHNRPMIEKWAEHLPAACPLDPPGDLVAGVAEIPGARWAP